MSCSNVRKPASKGVLCATLANSLKKQYYCEKCNNAFSKLCYLSLHMKLHAFVCALCSRRYFYKSLLRRHILKEHKFEKVEDEQKFECEKCFKLFLTKRDCKLHQWTDHLYKYRCLMNNCQKVFKTKEEYDNHNIQSHSDKFHRLGSGHRMTFKIKEKYDKPPKKSSDNKFHCPKINCQMVFMTKEEYVDHKKKHRLKQCKICGKKGTCINRHVLIHLPKSCHCRICNKKFRYREDLRKHLLIHLKIKQHACKYCGKSFTQKGNLDSHVRMHTGKKPFKCNICNFSFVRKDHLTNHEKAVHGGKEARKFSCDKCQFVALTQRQVNRHKNRCHKKIFQCEVCSVVLKCQKTLERHSFIHSDVKPFPCCYCSREYARKSDYTKHLKSAHS